MAMNKMNDLIDKIERRLGTKPLLLPDDIKKSTWPSEVISKDTIPTFSRFFPHQVKIVLDTETCNKVGEYYVIDTKELLGGQELLGVKDIDWAMYGRDQLVQQNGIGLYDYFAAYGGYSMDDVMLLQARANMTSVFNNSIYIDFKEPNLIKLDSVTNRTLLGCKKIPLYVFVNHPSNLMTISPTKMETFESLAIADVASFLYEFLKYYDNLETVFANVDYKLSDLQQKASMRDDIVNTLKESFVNPANDNQPIIYCV
jgi:hypothetical protein